MATVALKHVSKVYPDGTRAVDDFSLEVADGEFVVLVGPSGCGKSTILRLLAGLETVSRGEILIDEAPVNDVPAQQRNTAMVFQNYALYPHKTVRQNLAFPLRMMQVPKSERKERIARVAETLGLEPWLDQRPKNLSGGERQRVAMGRAMVRDPSVFLLDEPLSNLDAKLRVEVRAEIAQLQRRLATTTVYVTHDQIEAMTLGNRVAVLRAGHLQQVGAGQELYDKPANVFVAGFIGSPGMAVFPTRLHSSHRDSEKPDSGRIEFGEQQLSISTAVLQRFMGGKHYDNQQVLAGLRPEAFRAAQEVSQENRVQVQVVSKEALGHEHIIYFQSPTALYEDGPAPSAQQTEPSENDRMAARLPADHPAPSPNETVLLGVDTNQMVLFDLNGNRLNGDC